MRAAPTFNRLPRSHTLGPPPQSLSEPGKIAHCRELAERGLSDLNAYRGAGGGGEGSISLKGATH